MPYMFALSICVVVLLVGFLYALYFFLLGLTGGELDAESIKSKQNN